MARLTDFIDWGDAGWGDTAVEFTKVPMSALPTTVAAYEEIGPDLLGENGIGRVIWSRLSRLLLGEEIVVRIVAAQPSVDARHRIARTRCP